MKIFEHLETDNLHHAYLIEGGREEISLQVLELCERLGVKTSGNPDFYHISIDSLKIDDALYLRTLGSDRSFGGEKKIFVVATNSMSIDAQNVLLKMFEEPIPGTHFFIIVPDANSLLKTLVSRFYFIKHAGKGEDKNTLVKDFISMNLRSRLDFLKDFLTEPDEEDEGGNAVVLEESARSRALNFLNALEGELHSDYQDKLINPSYFRHFFKVREFLRMPGSSVKSMMESVAIITPIFKI